ncbi:PREDICTED: eukaryotic translation initiation factor-like [Camelina sativa]|uniref:Eukaryotic translation initiation factor-like n=1 Tax=Camelina sativa TaxID=90675 RepID=A0ABM1R3P0_CAMSA|nr:PREDICTED: eukaryotic translation initiation factor-like [Camelina sativa]
MVFDGTDELSDEIRKMNAPDQKKERKDKERLLKLRTLGNLRLVGELFLKQKISEENVLDVLQDVLGGGMTRKRVHQRKNLKPSVSFSRLLAKSLMVRNLSIHP